MPGLPFQVLEATYFILGKNSLTHLPSNEGGISVKAKAGKDSAGGLACNTCSTDHWAI